MSTFISSGNPFLANTVTTNGQFTPSIDGLIDGRLLVSWTSEGQIAGGLDTDIRQQVFQANGSKVGTETAVNTATTARQAVQKAAPLQDGGYVVVWEDWSQGNENLAVRGQIFMPDGSLMGSEFLVNTTDSGIQRSPDVATLSTGGFVVVWGDSSNTGLDTSGFGAIRAQRFGADGSKQQAEFLVNTTVTGSQGSPVVTALSGGRFFVAWIDGSQTGADTSVSAVRAQLFDADGSKLGAEILVNTTVAGFQGEIAIATLSDGRFVVTWTDDSQGGGDSNVFGQLFSAEGTKSGNEFQVNTTTAASQSDAAVTALADGRFVVSWTDTSANPAEFIGGKIRAQVFLANGTKQGEEVVVYNGDNSLQFDSALSTFADGRIAVGWTSAGGSLPNADGFDVVVQILDPRQAAVTLFGRERADQWIGTGFGDILVALGGDDQVLGGDGLDYLYGGEGNDTLLGEGGDDVLFGEAANDILVGGAGADYIDGGAGADYADGGDANDIFLMGAGNDTALGQAGNDYADLGANDDYVDGGAGEDILLGGLGNDVLLGGADKDYIDAGDGLDYADGGDANDIFLMGAGNDTALGQAGNDYFDMGDGDDTAFGGTGDDIFLGGAGNDVFEGGSGLDVALGGAGNDSYTVRATSGLLLVYDFAAGGAEDALLFTADTGITSFAQAQAKLSFNASVYASVLTVDADTSVWLVGVTNAQLTAADFVFF